jgi:hypothetical protein
MTNMTQTTQNSASWTTNRGYNASIEYVATVGWVAAWESSDLSHGDEEYFDTVENCMSWLAGEDL